MNTFYIARHGETEYNREHRLSGWEDSPLTETGLEPTKRVIPKLAGVQFDAIYSSDLGRAATTANAVANGLNFAGEVQLTAGLREVNYGEAGGMLSAEAYVKYPGLDSDTHYAPPGGESLDQMQQRVFETVSEINNTHSDANILLVCHSGVMAALKASHIGQDFGKHNISEAYAHDFVGKFTFVDGAVTSFEEFLG